MILRNRLKIIAECYGGKIFDTLKMEAIVFESDTENEDYSRYLHGRSELSGFFWSLRIVMIISEESGCFVQNIEII